MDPWGANRFYTQAVRFAHSIPPCPLYLAPFTCLSTVPFFRKISTIRPSPMGAPAGAVLAFGQILIRRFGGFPVGIFRLPDLIADQTQVAEW